MLDFDTNLSIFLIFISGFLLTFIITKHFNKTKENEESLIILKNNEIHKYLENLLILEEENKQLIDISNETSLLLKRTYDQESFKFNNFIKDFDKKNNNLLLNKKEESISEFLNLFSQDVYKRIYEKIKE